ncbi:cytochrome b5-like heme/steroid binding domain-containing protein [Aspergillus undulatus]|uniref:cytochrome b5-like heme/steroid binding domain-containing protein n=1 Tax=Aspergillus undulatus TaxID=1810928 RepID=UPI003CCE1737
MGWLSLSRRAEQHILSVSTFKKTGAYSEHTEDISISSPTESPQIQPPAQSRPFEFLGQIYPFQHPSVSDSDIPYIDPSILSLVEENWKKNAKSPTADRTKPSSESHPKNEPPAWIVIDNIVYDCTAFQTTHPGGSVVIRSFVGQDCSWQFWRFHSMQHMRDVGRPLRIGRTSGIRNRFKEPPRYVGVAGGFDDDW